MSNPAAAARLTTKADQAAAERLLKRAVARTITMIRAGDPRPAYVAVLEAGIDGADLLLEARA